MDSRDQSLAWSEIFRGTAAVAFGLVGDESAAGLETVHTSLDVPGPVTHGDMVQICQLLHSRRRFYRSQFVDNPESPSWRMMRVIGAMPREKPKLSGLMWAKLTRISDAVFETSRPIRMRITRGIRP